MQCSRPSIGTDCLQSASLSLPSWDRSSDRSKIWTAV
jgi:hypothetical protein